MMSPSPRARTLSNPHESNHHHPLNISYTIPSTTTNIDHITSQSHMQYLNNRVEYISLARRNNLQINGEKIHPPTKALDELHQFMKIKADNLRKNMLQVTTTFKNASTNLNHLKEEQRTILKRPSRIPVSTRYRSPSPTKVVHRKVEHYSLEKLRWYCLARKFSILWQDKVFGYYLRPIKHFYQQKLLKKYFNLWKSIIQDEKYEYVAIEFHHQKLSKKYFQIWFNLTLLNQKAMKYINHKRIQTTWYTWKKQLNKRRLHQQQCTIANKQYYRTVLSRFYHTWQIRTYQRRHEIEKTLRANYCYRIHLYRICFNAWLTYAEYRRQKDIHKTRVRDYYQRHLMGKIYSKWKQALTRKLLIQQHKHRLAQLQERVLMRWALQQWKSYVNDLADEQRTMHMAEQHSERRIMRFALTNLHQYAIKCRIKRRLNWTAVQHRARMIKLFYYRIWKNRLEQRENIYMLVEFRKAESFYNMKITIRYWFCWRRFINDCRQEHARLTAADTYFNSKLLRKYFYYFRINIKHERYEQLLEKQADDYYRLRYLRLYYMHWKVQTHMHQQYQINWNIAIIHEANVMRRRIFNTWLNKAHSRLIDNEQHIVAERHYFRTIVVRTWLTWRQLIDERHNEERSERIAVQFYYHALQRRVLNLWRLYIHHCRYMKQMYRESEQFYLQHRGKTILFEWLNKARHRQRLMIIVNERFHRKQRNTLRQYFRQWRQNFQEEKDERQLTQYAIDHYNRSMKRKILLAWNNEMIQQVLIDNENEMKLNKYKHERNRLYLQIIYHKWKQITNERLHDRFLAQRSQIFYETNLLRKLFSQWKEQHHFNMRIKLLERQAIWFDRMRLVSRIYTRWKQVWQSEQRLNEEKHRALLFWALQLQRKCFLKWLIYTSERRRKKTRYNEATHRRHDELIRDCLRQFLIYTDHTKQRRQALFIHQQVYLYHDRNALASKYVAKWRAFVKEASARKQQIERFTKRNTNVVSTVNHRFDLIQFDNSPPKITNRPRPRKPAFLSDSFSTPAVDKTDSEILLDNIQTSPLASPRLLPTIGHSLHSPFISVKQSINIQKDPSPPPPPPLLLPPSAFEINHNEIKKPLSSRIIIDRRVPLSHRSHSTQPSINTLNNKDNLLNVKERLEIYLNTKAKLKRLRQQLANLSPSQVDRQLEEECRELTAFIISEKLHLTSILQNL